jgi:hypothetical protein
MTAEEFIDTIRLVVRDSAVEGTLSLLENPPGRRPAKQLVELSQWFAGLDDRDKQMLTELARLVAHDAVFGMLCVLDGVRQVESTPEKGRFELRYIKGTSVSELTTGSSGEYLHELLPFIW